MLFLYSSQYAQLSHNQRFALAVNTNLRDDSVVKNTVIKIYISGSNIKVTADSRIQLVSQPMWLLHDNENVRGDTNYERLQTCSKHTNTPSYSQQLLIQATTVNPYPYPRYTHYPCARAMTAARAHVGCQKRTPMCTGRQTRQLGHGCHFFDTAVHTVACTELYASAALEITALSTFNEKRSVDISPIFHRQMPV